MDVKVCSPSRARVAMWLLPAIIGCQATQHASSGPAGSGPNAMLDRTAVGKHRCNIPVADSSPFVVEWDATDLATFEGSAARDVVFVRFAGCQIDLLYGCSDSGVPGLYGRYESPTFTSGTVESFTMANEDELYAKLPLGAIAFGSNVKTGETLELKYLVSGVVRSTRDQIYRDALAKNPRCQAATHYVAQYNLGAFRLLAHKNFQAGAEGSVASIGGHAKTQSDSSNLKEGGKLESCDTAAQRQCRVPIRLVLRPIVDGAAPAQSALTAAAPVGGDGAQPAYELRRSAQDKMEAGDGPGCLADLDRAAKIDNSEQGRLDSAFVGAQCKMLAGDCDGGKKELAEFYRARNKDRTQTDESIQRTVDAFATNKCPTSKLDSPQAKISHIATRIKKARERGDATTCSAEAAEIEALLKTTPKEQQQSVASMLTLVVDCLDELGKCDDARATFKRYYEFAIAPRLGGAAGTSADAMYRPKKCPKK